MNVNACDADIKNGHIEVARIFLAVSTSHGKKSLHEVLEGRLITGF